MSIVRVRGCACVYVRVGLSREGGGGGIGTPWSGLMVVVSFAGINQSINQPSFVEDYSTSIIVRDTGGR